MNRSIISGLLFVVTLPLGPVATAAGGNAKTSATFYATASGEIGGGPQSSVNGITSSTTQVVIRLMPADLSLLQTAVETGHSCFWQGSYEGPLTIDRARSGAATAQYFFTARAKDGVTDIGYRLDLRGTFDDGSNWLPAVGTFATVTVQSWSVAAEGKGQGRSACSGNGLLNSSTIVVERLN